ncbi:MAG TPA: condensation domain-containing protein, partial [Longimicrobium sp.]|nr:condensation domain-containing protein [Longimicrobium sp.]
LERELEFWRARLTGAPVLELPTDRARPPVQSFSGATVPFRLSKAMMVRVGGVARSEGATPFMVLLSAFNVLLSRWSGVDDVVVGSPVAGRVPEETEPLVGVFVNTLALRADLSGDPAFRDVISRVREATLDAYAHQEVPFERLVDALKIERSLRHHPLFQVIFSMHAGGYDAPEFPGLAVTVEEGDAGASKVDLVLALSEEEDGFAGAFQYASDLFDEATIRRMASHLAVLLEAALADPSLPLSSLPLAPAGEAALLDSFRATADGEAARAHVLDDYQRPSPIGVSGELYLAQKDGALVPTGERARWRADGRLERIGRIGAPPEDVRAVAPTARPTATPRTELEHLIARVWEEVLGTASVRVDDNFFEIGGHSLLLAPVQEKVRDRLGREISIVELFQYPTVESLAAFIAPREAVSVLDDDVIVETDGPDADAPSAARGRGAGRREMLRRGRR